MEEEVFFFPEGTLVILVFAVEFPELQCDNEVTFYLLYHLCSIDVVCCL